MTEDQDNAGEVIVGAVRVALTAAGQLAEQAARRREAALREAERDSAARATTSQSQLAAERELALRSVRDVVRRGDDATVEEVVRAWGQASGWDDPTMVAERAQLEDLVRVRFGIDASDPVADSQQAKRASAASLVVGDVQLQADDARHRAEVQGGGAGPDSGSFGQGAVAAWALAAQSHPTPSEHAARRPRATPTARMGGRRRGPAVQVQEPGR